MCVKHAETFRPFTVRHRSGADICRQAAAFGVFGMVAGHNLDCVTGEMLQVGYHR